MSVPFVRRRAALALLPALAVLAGLPGCGFQLRRPTPLNFRSIALVGFGPRSPLADELRRQLASQVEVLPTPDRAEVVLYALDDLRERSVVAQTAAAQVRELQLRVRFNFRVGTPGGRELVPRAELMLARDLSYTELQGLAKDTEQDELYRDLQADIVAQVLRRLAAIRL